MLKKIKEWILKLVLSRVQIGGHCGCCGVYIPNEIFDNAWAWGLCIKCDMSDKIVAAHKRKEN